MKQLIEIILALPLPKFRSYLRIQKGLKPEGLLYSMLCFKAVDAGFSENEVIQFPDPLAADITRFSKELIRIRQLSRPGNGMSEDDRLRLQIVLLKKFNRDHAPNLTILYKKLEDLIAIYIEVGDGESANSLNSLYAAVSFMKPKEGWYSYFFQKKNNAQPELLFENEGILDVYASIHKRDEIKLINLLGELESKCAACKEKLDAFYNHQFVAALAISKSVERALSNNPHLKKLVHSSQIFSRLQACLYEKEDAAERLALFRSVFHEEYIHLDEVTALPIGKEIKQFVEEVQQFFNDNRAAIPVSQSESRSSLKPM